MSGLAVLVSLYAVVSVDRAYAAPALGSYGADPSMVSVSGVSSGANMAVQLHVAYSQTFMGVGAVAGAPYYCAKGSYTRATAGSCSAFGNAYFINIAQLKTKTETWASQGKVDDTQHMATDKVYIYRGKSDVVVPEKLARKLEDYYNEFISDSSYIKTVYDVDSGHGFLTENAGVDCNLSRKPYINNCNYNQAYELLNHIYGNLQKPTASTVATGQLLAVDQKEFRPTSLIFMADVGYVYIPTGCDSPSSDCKLHVSLHGCDQTTESIGNMYYTETGYNEVGELNDIIILYPQCVRIFVLPWINPVGCWDWWGYSDKNVFGLTSSSDYANNQGWQTRAIKGMVDRILA